MCTDSAAWMQSVPASAHDLFLLTLALSVLESVVRGARFDC
jgi:hypothetical protein